MSNKYTKRLKELQDFINEYDRVQELCKRNPIQAEIERSCYFEEVPADAIKWALREIKRLQIYDCLEYQKYLYGYIEENYIPKEKVEKKILQAIEKLEKENQSLKNRCASLKKENKLLKQNFEKAVLEKMEELEEDRWRE